MASSNYPLLVKVQCIDFKDLDIRGNASFKPRNVTCVETSNLYIFVGVTSGTVYVFSRQDLSFKFMIPFTGGKVCCISCVDSEKQIAIGSIRGQVSLYQITDQQKKLNNTPHSSLQLSFFKHINTLEHHKGNEITEIHWSSNGRYLFVGDSKGLVSQSDVGSIEEFPRPVSLSQIILKLKTRVIQIHFLFPYLAVCTVSAVFLCDIENEDFIRVQFETKRDIRATGVLLLLLDSNAESKAVDVRLYVSEMTSTILHCFSLQGQLIESRKLESNTFLTRNPVPAFDPVSTDPVLPTFKTSDSEHEHLVSLGKLLLSDSNLLISISNNNIYVIEPKEMKIIFWNDDYQKIQNAKLLSNYAFIWSGSKVQVVSFTQVLPYSEQLFSAGGIIPLQRWIHHILSSINWKQDEKNIEIENYFKCLMSGSNIWDEITEFQIAVAEIVPFKLLNESLPQDVPKINPLLRSFNKLLESLEAFNKIKFNSSTAVPNDEDERSILQKTCCRIWNNAQEIYRSKDFQFNNSKFHNLSLVEVVKEVESFYRETQLWKLYDELQQDENADIKLLEKRFLSFFARIQSSKDSTFLRYDDEDIQLLYFSAFTFHSNSVHDWFNEFGISKNRIISDGFLADLFLLVLPLFSVECRTTLIKDIQNCNPDFCVWLLTSTFFNCNQGSPYELQLKSLFLPAPPSFDFMKSILSSIYGDLAQEDLRYIAASLHHVISIIFFNMGITDKQKNFPILLLNLFPLKHWYKSQVEKKLEELMQLNPNLLEFFKVGCLQYNQDVETCKCGIPLKIVEKSSQPSILNTVQEFVLKHSISLSNHSMESKDFKNNGNFQFAMKTGLMDFYGSLEDVHIQGAENSPFLLEAILRSPSCAYSLLNRINTPLDEVNPDMLLKKRKYIMENNFCELCGDPLGLPVDFMPIHIDLIGIWLLNKAKCMEEFISYVESNQEFNTVGFFSFEFYKYAASWKRGLNGDVNRNGLEELPYYWISETKRKTDRNILENLHEN